MFIIYPNKLAGTYDTKHGTPSPVKLYARHFMNGLILNYLIKRSTKFDVKQRSNIELEICDRKQIYWHRKLNSEAIIEIQKVCKANFMAHLVDYYKYL